MIAFGAAHTYTAHIKACLISISMQNSKETWRQIGKIFNLGKRKTHGAETVSTEQFYKYFKQQNAIPPNRPRDEYGNPQ